jgi:aminoglycoside phosphotransferase (APT) family kinase protein
MTIKGDVPGSLPRPRNEMDAKVYDWITGNIGPVVAFDRQARWRPGWDVNANRDGEILQLYVRGPRGDTYVSPVDMVQEAAIHRVFEANGIPAPRIYGMIDDPVCIVMERLPGTINTSAITDETERQQVRDSFIEIVARIHALPLSAFEAVKLTVPITPEDIALNLYGPSEMIFRDRIGGRPWPLMEFAAAWLRRNVPQDRTRATFVNYDGGQFLYDKGVVTGLIDFEVSSFGDPAAELAGMRLRDSSEPLGDLTAMIRRYETLTGDTISRKLIEYHTAGFCGVNGFLMWPLMFESAPEQDYVAYLHYSVATSRWMIRAIADYIGVTLVDPPEPVAVPLGFAQAGRHLVRHIEAMDGDTPADEYVRDSAAAQALYLARVNDYGLSVLQANLADVAELTGVSHPDWQTAQAALSAWVVEADFLDDACLVQHFHNWLMRQSHMLKGCGQAAFLIEKDLQPIRDR